MFPWADPGALRWVINYSTMDEAQVRRLLDADFNSCRGRLHPGVQMLREAGVHRMRPSARAPSTTSSSSPSTPNATRWCSRPRASQVIYNNPARHAGCFNHRPGWAHQGRMDAVQVGGADCIFFDNPMTWRATVRPAA